MKKIRITLLSLALLLFLGVFGYRFVKPTADVIASYGARVVCSCVFVGGRSDDSCAMDLEEGMEIARLEIDRKEKRVTATIPLISKRSAEFIEDGTGCLLD